MAILLTMNGADRRASIRTTWETSPTRAPVRNAISRFNQTDCDSKNAKHEAARKILAAAKRHGIEVDDDSDVAKASKG